MVIEVKNEFSVMSKEDILNVNGGWNWAAVLGGAGLVVACIGVTVGTGGMGLVSLPVILGAGTNAEIAIAGASLVGSALGGAAVGYGAVN